MAHNLLITPYISEIISLIRDNQVVQITAETGSGKSIGVPTALALCGKKVFVSVPTRVSAISLASYTKILNPNMWVGHAAEGISKYNYKTQLVYATGGHIRRKMLSYFTGSISKYGLSFTDILILDETHTGSIDNTIILSLWMHAHKLGFRVPKLVLMSATPSVLPVVPEPVILTIPVPTPFPVEVIYDVPDYMDSVYEHAVNIAVSKHADGISGDFLIFVPGSRDVDDLFFQLGDQIPDAKILRAYSALDADEIKLIYSPCTSRKIIVATNIAESSITIDGLSLVIDTMQCKETVVSGSGGTRLETVCITKSSARQRLGRVGRTCPGICYRLISEDRYDMLDEHRIPEIERIPIHNVVMEFLKAGIDPAETIVGIDSHQVHKSIKLLTRLDMITVVDGKPVVTACGDFAPTVPLGVRNAAFLWNWIQEGGSIYPGVVVASLVDVHSTGYFYIPRKKSDMNAVDYTFFCDKYIQDKFSKWMGPTTVHTYLNMWNEFTSSLGKLHYRLINEPGTVRVNNWVNSNSINNRQFNELISIVSQVYCASRQYGVSKHNLNVSNFLVKAVADTAILIFQKIYIDNIMRPDWAGNMRHPKTGTRFLFDNRRIISDIERISIGSDIIPLVTREITTKAGNALGYVEMSIPGPSVPDSIVEDSSDDSFTKYDGSSKWLMRAIDELVDSDDLMSDSSDERSGERNYVNLDLEKALSEFIDLEQGMSEFIDSEKALSEFIDSYGYGLPNLY